MPARKYDRDNILLMRIVTMYFRMKNRSKECNFKNLISMEEFIEFGINSEEYKKLYQFWQDNGRQFKYAPSIDRIDPCKGYEKGNLQFLTVSENVSKSNKEIYHTRYRNMKKKVKLISIDNDKDLIFNSTTEAARYIKVNDSVISMVIIRGSRVKTYIPFLIDRNYNLIFSDNQKKNIKKLIKTFRIKTSIEKDGIKLYFNSITEASEYLNFSNKRITQYIRKGKVVNGWIIKKVENKNIDRLKELFKDIL